MNILDYSIYAPKRKYYPDLSSYGSIDYYEAEDIDFYVWEQVGEDLYALKNYNQIKSFAEIIKDHKSDNEILYKEQLFYDKEQMRLFIYDHLTNDNNDSCSRIWIEYWLNVDKSTYS